MGMQGERTETREQVVVEAGLLADAKLRIVRDEHGDYHTEYAEGERASRTYERGLDAALARLCDAVKEEVGEDEREMWREQHGNYIRIDLEGGSQYINTDAIVFFTASERDGEKYVRIRTTEPRGVIPLRGSAAEQFLAAIEAEE